MTYYHLNNSSVHYISKKQLMFQQTTIATLQSTPNRPSISEIPQESAIFLAVLLAVTACMMVILGFITVRVFQRYWVIREEERALEEATAAIALDFEAAVPVSGSITWEEIHPVHTMDEENAT